MPGPPIVAIHNPDIPGLELQIVTLEAFEEVWEARGWEIAEEGIQPDVVYDIPSSEKGAPWGVATLDGDGNVVQLAQGPTGGISEAEVEVLIAAAIAEITPESIGAIPESEQTVTLNGGVLTLPTRAGHPADNGESQWYALDAGTVWVMAPGGTKTQLVPGWVSPSVELGLEKTVNSLTLSTVVSIPLEPEAAYDIDGLIGYESTVAASGERLRITFDPPPGATGWYGIQSMNSTGAASGTLSSNFIAKKLTETFDIGGSGAGEERYFRIVGTVYTDEHLAAPDAEANFDFRARLSTLDGAGVPLVPAKIYGANTVDYDASRITMNRIA